MAKKAKLDLKDFFLRRGEVLAMCAAGFFLAVLLIWSATTWAGAKDPHKIAKDMTNASQNVKRQIGNTDPGEPLPVPPWIEKAPGMANKQIERKDFNITTPLFDPTAQPNTKRENPLVFPIRAYQVDLVRSAMQGYDIILDPEGKAAPQIGVYELKEKGKIDDVKLQKVANEIKNASKKGQKIKAGFKAQPPPKAKAQFPMDEPGSMAGPGMYGGPYGLEGAEFNQGAQRVDPVIKYIPLDEIDEAVRNGKRPAVTVIPLRMVTIHAVVPYQKQLAEIKRAGRFSSDAEAKQWGPWYDGFEVQRRVTRTLASGKVIVVEEWAELSKDVASTTGNYPFEEKYIELIDTRKIADHFDEEYIPYFLKPEMMLSMPLPQLAKDLGVSYPDIRLTEINDNIKKLDNRPKLDPTELAKRLQGMRTKSELYKPKTADSAAGFGLEPERFGGPTGIIPPKEPMKKGPALGSSTGYRPPVGYEGYDPYSGVETVSEVENFLLRFVDCDVKPGRTYQYRVRLRMLNPNYGQDKLVANPEHAKDKYKVLYSPWTQLDQSIAVPAESFLFSYDVKTYRDQVDTAYPLYSNKTVDPPIIATDETKALNKLLQVKENQAIVQLATWMSEVRLSDSSIKREPVGAWVVAEMPVGRGDYIGRKQFVKLPIWSSERQQYVLREVGDKIIRGSKEVAQPKGWLVDFSSKSVLVDFEGGRVRTKVKVTFDKDKGTLNASDNTVVEDTATEMLIVRPDGKLLVRNSMADETNNDRKEVSKFWSDWLKLVEENQKKAATTPDMGMMDEFRPKN
ncbi:MAG: hypothetical protein L0241_24130 [Planctomycetia bacterium]|nr:hypothetical protein [Planctomycetia bacterium]